MPGLPAKNIISKLYVYIRKYVYKACMKMNESLQLHVQYFLKVQIPSILTRMSLTKFLDTAWDFFSLCVEVSNVKRNKMCLCMCGTC